MNGLWDTLKQKVGGLPVGLWALLGTIALALYLIRKKSSSSSSDQAAADQTNSDLGSAAELANMFEVAGLMPYQGGDVYINTTTTQNPPPSDKKPTPLPLPTRSTPPSTTTTPKPGPTSPSTHKPQAIYTVKKGDTLTSIAKKYGFTAAQVYKYNTTSGVRTASAIATLKKRGPNLIYSNEKIYIPPKGYK